MIRPLGRGLAMEQLRYANEVRSIDEVPIPKVDVKKAELDMAVQLVEQGAWGKFEPQKYEDTVKMRIQEQIQRKGDGRSEKRRVGEEGRARGSPDHSKKKGKVGGRLASHE